MAEEGRLEGMEKAAIFLLSMGEEFTTEVFKKLSREEIKGLTCHILTMGHISRETIDQVLQEFQQKFSMPGLPVIGDEDFVRKVLISAIGQPGVEHGNPEVEDFIKSALEGRKSREAPILEITKQMDPKALLDFIKDEHPQTIAFILSRLDYDQASRILVQFPEDLQTDVALRIAKLDTVSPGIMGEVEEVLRNKVKAVGTPGRAMAGGIHSAAEILNRVDHATEERILARIDGENPELTTSIRQSMFVFQDLLGIDDKGTGVLLQEVKREDLLLALKTASDELKEKMFRNMSERAREMIKDDLDIMGLVRLRDVQIAQQAIVDIAKRLDSEGKLVIPGKGEDDKFV